MADKKVAFNKAVALERLGDDEELLTELAEVYLDDQDSMMDGLRAAVEAGDAEELARAAHKLKGAASNFCADATVAAALSLEEMGRNGDPDGADVNSRCVSSPRASAATLGRVPWPPAASWGAPFVTREGR